MSRCVSGLCTGQATPAPASAAPSSRATQRPGHVPTVAATPKRNRSTAFWPQELHSPRSSEAHVAAWHSSMHGPAAAQPPVHGRGTSPSSTLSTRAAAQRDKQASHTSGSAAQQTGLHSGASGADAHSALWHGPAPAAAHIPQHARSGAPAPADAHSGRQRSVSQPAVPCTHQHRQQADQDSPHGRQHSWPVHERGALSQRHLRAQLPEQGHSYSRPASANAATSAQAQHPASADDAQLASRLPAAGAAEQDIASMLAGAQAGMHERHTAMHSSSVADLAPPADVPGFVGPPPGIARGGQHDASRHQRRTHGRPGTAAKHFTTVRQQLENARSVTAVLNLVQQHLAEPPPGQCNPDHVAAAMRTLGRVRALKPCCVVVLGVDCGCANAANCLCFSSTHTPAA